MVLRVVIVGPGRVGMAFAQRLVANGVHFVGFVGRDLERAAAACREIGRGEALDWSSLSRTHVVVFAVGDGDLRAVLRAAVQSGHARACSLWVHTSGRNDLSVFDECGVVTARRGALHPVLPFPTAAAGAVAMLGAPAVILGEASSQRLLARLAGRLGLEAIRASAGNRVLYHAACALAANGLTALWAQVQQVFTAAGGLSVDAQRVLTSALMASALRSCAHDGAAIALSGPVRRGDVATVAAHRQQLASVAPGVLQSYLSLMRAALQLARQAGLDPARARAVEQVLE